MARQYWFSVLINLRALRVTLMTLSIALWFGSFAVHAQPTGPVNHISASLIAETAQPSAGSEVTLAIDMKPEPGWHGYWSNPGEAGFAARFDWSLPPGVTISEARFPVPKRLIVAGLMNHVYEGEHALLFTLKIPRGIRAGTQLPIVLQGNWLSCTDKICVPETARLATDLTTGSGEISQGSRRQFDIWRAALPQPLGSGALFERDGNRVRIGIPFPADAIASDPWFFAQTSGAISYSAPQSIGRHGDLMIIETGVGTNAPAGLSGVLSIGGGRGLWVEARAGTVPPSSSAGNQDWVAILAALGGALLGGVILNIMPCVFPIISLKAISLARSGGNERAAKQDALAYSAGVILVCLGLGALLLTLRAAGMSVGWAFQLQEPRVILILLLLSTAITLNLAGVFTLSSFGGGQRLVDRGGLGGAFWTGALAAFVATPCTGPFMAAALGAALVLPTAAALAIFAGLGVGLALPFLLLGFVPLLRTLIPRPGAWMGTFQKILTIPMALTTAALVWLLWRQGGSGALVIAIASISLLAMLVWWAGQRAHRGRKVLVPVAAGISLVAAVGMATLGLTAQGPSVGRGAGTGQGVLGAQRYSEERLAALRAQGRPVFVYFTADWCVTCKVNEKVAIDTQSVATAFARGNVAVLVGDWTNGDPVISRALEAHGRSGVPLYLWYREGADAAGVAPVIMPQLLTPGMLVALVN